MLDIARLECGAFKNFQVHYVSNKTFVCRDFSLLCGKLQGKGLFKNNSTSLKFRVHFSEAYGEMPYEGNFM